MTEIVNLPFYLICIIWCLLNTPGKQAKSSSSILYHSVLSVPTPQNSRNQRLPVCASLHVADVHGDGDAAEVADATELLLCAVWVVHGHEPHDLVQLIHCLQHHTACHYCTLGFLHTQPVTTAPLASYPHSLSLLHPWLLTHTACHYCTLGFLPTQPVTTAPLASYTHSLSLLHPWLLTHTACHYCTLGFLPTQPVTTAPLLLTHTACHYCTLGFLHTQPVTTAPLASYHTACHYCTLGYIQSWMGQARLHPILTGAGKATPNSDWGRQGYTQF